MTDMSAFEARFVRAYRGYLVDAPTHVDAAALADAVAVERRPRLSGWTWPFDTGRPLVWAAVALLLVLALGAALVGSSRLLERPYPILIEARSLGLSRAVSGDELWTADYQGVWHYVGNAWQGPLSPPLPDGETVSGLALGPDGATWISGQTTIAVLHGGAWRVVWQADADRPISSGLDGLDVAPDGTVWFGQGSALVRLRQEATGYTARSVACPRTIARVAAATDGTIYVGGFLYDGGGNGLARSDGITCTYVDPLGDGQVHEVGDLSAGPGGSLLATLFDELQNGDCPCRTWLVMLQDGRWSTISGPVVAPGVSRSGAIAPDGHPWRGVDLGLQRYEDGVWRVVATSPAGSLTMAPDGVLWYATDRGIERIKTVEVGH